MYLTHIGIKISDCPIFCGSLNGQFTSVNGVSHLLGIVINDVPFSTVFQAQTGWLGVTYLHMKKMISQTCMRSVKDETLLKKKEVCNLKLGCFNPIALRKAKIVYSFCLSECKRVELKILLTIFGLGLACQGQRP